MPDQIIDPESPASLEFVRAGAEKAVAAMDNSHRARSAMIYSHVTALTKLMADAGDEAELSQANIEAIILDLPEAYRFAFMLDTLNEVKVGKYDTPETRAQALARTERGVMQQKQRFEYKVMTVTLTNAQETACALGNAGWRYVGQSTPVLAQADNGEPFVSSLPPPAVTLTFERALAEEEKPEVTTTPARTSARPSLMRSK